MEIEKQSADLCERVDSTTMGDKLYDDFPKDYKFKRLKCVNCGGILFEVLKTDKYETTAQCSSCKNYYVVHEG